MSRKNYFEKILILFGVITLLTSLVDMAVIVIPLHLSAPQWVFASSQEVAERCIVPIIGIIAILAGFYLGNAENNKVSLNIERYLSIFSILFGVGLVIVTVFYALTINTIENQMISSLKKNSEGMKNQAMSVYSQVNAKENVVPKEELDKYLTSLNKNLALETTSSKNKLLKKNVKTIINLVLFTLVYIFIGILGFKSSDVALKKLRYNKVEPEKQ